MKSKADGWARFITVSLMLAMLVGFSAGAPGVQTVPVHAATSDGIEDAITRGVDWLARNQNDDGSWGTRPYVPAKTCFVLTKLQERAYELGYSSPFDSSYAYSNTVSLGWEYIFTTTRTLTQMLSVQDHTDGASGTMDDPDSNGNGYGIYFYGASSRYVYATGICLMALGASGTPDRPNDGGLDFDGDGNAETFQEIAQEAVDWLAFAQADLAEHEGGWGYSASDNYGAYADNSNSGYAVLGLASAEAFGCTVPEWVRTELNAWIDAVQADDGGSRYRPAVSGANELRTGNLLFEMTFYGDDPSTQRFQDAVGYIERHWQDANVNPGWGYNRTPAEYQAMYCLMRGLEYSDVDLLDTDGDGERDDAWYNQEPSALPAQDFASVLVEQQLEDGVVDGSWPGNCLHGGSVLCTAWALLTLEYPLPSPSIGKTVTPTTDVAYRDTVTYTVVLSNSGKRDAFGVLLTDTLPSEVDFGSWVVQPSGTSVISDRITWSGTVPAGEVITFTFTALYVIDPDTVTNTVEFKSTTGTGSDDAVFTAKSIYFLYLPLIKLEDDDYWPKAPSSR